MYINRRKISVKINGFNDDTDGETASKLIFITIKDSFPLKGHIKKNHTVISYSYLLHRNGTS